MKLIVGLGNPGPQYERTKHNVGFWFIDTFANKYGVSLSKKEGEAKVGYGSLPTPSGRVDFLLAEPQTFMNRSGRSVRGLLQRTGISFSDLVVVYDDLDLPCGRLRIRTQGSSGGHRGVASIIEAIETDRFIRIRIGIGRDPSRDPADYVLIPFSPDILKLVHATIDRGIEALPLLLEGKTTEAMNRYH
ncbi:MAG: aminoacyl-tRNA hydrolase [Candidatus Manganitrophaceae bacterium]